MININFFNKSVLGDKDIKKLLGKDIFIYPFNTINLKSSTYNFTASIVAFIEENGKRKLIVDNKNKIIIPARKTGLIYTEECIYVSNKICGTYHSRVSLSKKGLGHIGTTLDPYYFGTSLIALHNITDDPIEIKVGDSITSIMFYRITTKTKELHDNRWGDLNNEFEFYNHIDQADKTTILKKVEDFLEVDWRKNKNKLYEVVENEVRGLNHRTVMKTIDIVAIVIKIIIVLFVIYFIFGYNNELNNDYLIDNKEIIVSIIILILAIYDKIVNIIKDFF